MKIPWCYGLAGETVTPREFILINNTFMKTFDWHGEKLILEHLSYQDGSLAVRASSEMTFEDAEGNLNAVPGAYEPFATLTVNLDCYTGMKTQDDTHAYLDENNNGNWDVVGFLKKYDLATPTDVVVTSDYCRYRLYKWNTEKF